MNWDDSTVRLIFLDKESRKKEDLKNCFGCDMYLLLTSSKIRKSMRNSILKCYQDYTQIIKVSMVGYQTINLLIL